MRTRLRLALATVAALMFSDLGCSGSGKGGGDPEQKQAREELPDDPDELILFSIDGTAWQKRIGKPAPVQEGETLHGHPVLGKTRIYDPVKQRTVIAAVKEAIRRGPEQTLRCFVPRHALRLTKGGESVDVVVCFECLRYQTFRGANAESAAAAGNMADAPQPLLNKILSDAGVRLAPK